jgi:hypothetical protein
MDQISMQRWGYSLWMRTYCNHPTVWMRCYQLFISLPPAFCRCRISSNRTACPDIMAEATVYGTSKNTRAFAFVGGLLLIIALLASYLPACRAIRVESIVALRCDWCSLVWVIPVWQSQQRESWRINYQLSRPQTTDLYEISSSPRLSCKLQ